MILKMYFLNNGVNLQKARYVTERLVIWAG